MKRHHLRFVAVSSLLAALPTATHAQAFGINEIGTCAASRGFAVTGAPCQDASSIFWNPGAASSKKGWQVLVGGAAIKVGGSFTQDTTFRKYEADIPLALVPHVFVNYTAENSKLSYGVGVYAPYGLTSQWTDSFPGRFQALKAALATVYVQPNVSYRINDKWSVGGGPVMGISNVELIQALDLSEQQTTTPGVFFSQLGIAKRTEFGRANLKGGATAFGAHLGVYGQPGPDWTIGLRFLTPLEFSYDDADAKFTQTLTNIVLPPQNPVCYPAGTHPACGGNPLATVAIDALLAGQFTAGGALVDQGVSTKITHPAQIQAGVGYTGWTNWLVSVDYAWTGWKRFKDLPVTFAGPASGSNRVLFEDYNNTSSIRIGVQRTFTGGAMLRGGFSGVASAAPPETVTPLLPEQDRAYLSLGGEYPIFGKWAIEGGYLNVMAPGSRGRIIERTSRTLLAPVLNTGKYELTANVFTISLKGSL